MKPQILWPRILAEGVAIVLSILLAFGIQAWGEGQTVLGFFALISVALAGVGLYGVLASSVQGRTREIGLRMALGARREQLRRDVLKRSHVLSTLGLAFGVAGALALSRVLGSYLYDLPPVDPIAYLITAVGILLIAGLACYLPARRATQIDPLMALRHE